MTRIMLLLAVNLAVAGCAAPNREPVPATPPVLAGVWNYRTYTESNVTTPGSPPSGFTSIIRDGYLVNFGADSFVVSTSGQSMTRVPYSHRGSRLFWGGLRPQDMRAIAKLTGDSLVLSYSFTTSTGNHAITNTYSR